MTDQSEAAARAEIIARLAASREELRRVLDPPPNAPNPGSRAPGDRPEGFPRSRTMQMLMSGRGLGTLSAAAIGLLVARPRLALRLLRMLPVSAVAKRLLLRAFAALQTKRDEPKSE
jgi:hypothetical protein